MPTPLRLLGLAAVLATLTLGSLVLVSPGGEAPAQAVLQPVDCPAGTELPSGTIATIAGSGVAESSGDGGSALEAGLSTWDRTTGFTGEPIAIDAAGAILFSDIGASSVRRVDTDGTITTVAGPETGAPIVTPGGLAIGDGGEIYIADPGAARVWRLDPSGTITSIAGTGTLGSAGDGGPADEAQVQAGALVLGPDGELYIDDLHRIRVIDPDGTIRTVAGIGEPGFSPDGVEAITATLDSAGPAAIDVDGSIYVAEPGNGRVRRIDPNGIVTTVAGGGTADPAQGGNALEVSLTGSPYGVALDGEGGFYFSEWQRDRIWHVDASGTISTAVGGGTQSAGCGPATDAYISQPQAIAIDERGLFVVDGGHNRISVVTR
jgi:sugar lactone lactonase YvrE